MTRLWVRAATAWTEADGPPKPAMLPSRLRRRTSRLTRAVALVVEGLGESSHLSTLPLLIGSAFGEMVTTIDLLQMMHEGDGALSPTKFHNSVHNTAAGYVSIASGNRNNATAVSAGNATVGACLLEAAGLVSDAGEVVVAIAEDALPPAIAGGRDYGALAVGLRLGATPAAADLARLELAWSANVERSPVTPVLRRGNPCAPAHRLYEAIVGGDRTRVTLSTGALADGAPTWYVDIEDPSP